MKTKFAGGILMGYDSEKMDAIHMAVVKNYLPAVKSLLSEPETNVNSYTRVENDENYTPLMFALANQNLEMAEVLVQAGARIDFCTPPPFGTNQTPLIMATFIGDEKAVEFCLRHDADVQKEESTHKGAALGIAADKGYGKIVRMLVAREANLEQRNKCGWTALHMAVNHNHEEIVEFLIEKGASTSNYSEKGFTPIMKAVECNYVKVLKMLLFCAQTKQQHVDIMSGQGFTALFYAVHDNRPQCLLELLKAGATHTTRFYWPELGDLLTYEGLATHYKHSHLAQLIKNFSMPFENGCVACGSEQKKLVKCGRCLAAQYCSRACQEKHWKFMGHRYDCKKQSS